MTEPRLADLVYERRFDEALAIAQRLVPDTIHQELFQHDDRHLTDEAPCDEFLRLWYSSLTSPYLRAEAADCFAGTYTTELAPVPNAEYIGANMRTGSLRDLIATISDVLLGPEFTDLEETPEHPLDKQSAERWRAIGRAIGEFELPPAVDAVAPNQADS